MCSLPPSMCIPLDVSQCLQSCLKRNIQQLCIHQVLPQVTQSLGHAHLTNVASLSTVLWSGLQGFFRKDFKLLSVTSVVITVPRVISFSSKCKWIKTGLLLKSNIFWFKIKQQRLYKILPFISPLSPSLSQFLFSFFLSCEVLEASSKILRALWAPKRSIGGLKLSSCYKRPLVPTMSNQARWPYYLFVHKPHLLMKAGGAYLGTIYLVRPGRLSHWSLRLC